MKFLQLLYFSMSLNKFIDPTTLFSQYIIGLAYDSPMAFLAAKCMIPSIGQLFCSCVRKIFQRKFRSRMFPLWNLSRLSIVQLVNFELRIMRILDKTSSKQLEKSSTITTLAWVCSKIWTTVCEPMNPSPPGTNRVLISLIATSNDYIFINLDYAIHSNTHVRQINSLIDGLINIKEMSCLK